MGESKFQQIRTIGYQDTYRQGSKLMVVFVRVYPNVLSCIRSIRFCIVSSTTIWQKKASVPGNDMRTV